MYVRSVDYRWSTHPPRSDALQWYHNVCDSVSNQRLLDCLLNRLFRWKSKKTSFASLASVRGIHLWPVNSPHKGPVTQKICPFEDVIMVYHGTGTFMEIMDWTWCHGPGLYQVYISNWFGTGCFVVFGVLALLLSNRISVIHGSRIK